MVERIMLCKLHEPSARHEVAALTRGALFELEGLEELSVGLPADPASEKSWDMSVVMSFSTLASQKAALETEAFTRFMERELAPRCSVIKAWNFERLPGG